MCRKNERFILYSGREGPREGISHSSVHMSLWAHSLSPVQSKSPPRAIEMQSAAEVESKAMREHFESPYRTSPFSCDSTSHTVIDPAPLTRMHSLKGSDGGWWAEEAGAVEGADDMDISAISGTGLAAFLAVMSGCISGGTGGLIKKGLRVLRRVLLLHLPPPGL